MINYSIELLCSNITHAFNYRGFVFYTFIYMFDEKFVKQYPNLSSLLQRKMIANQLVFGVRMFEK